MVGREDVANAVALNAAIFNGARVIGPAVAGLTIGFFGGDVSVAFLINGISFAAVIAAYAAMRPEELQTAPVMIRPHSVGEVRESLAEGLRYVRRTELVLLATATVGVVSLLGMNFGVTIPALAREVLDTDATGFGFLMTATGIGSLAAALGIAFSGRSRPVFVPLGAIILGAGLVAAAAIDVYAFSLVAMLAIGFGAIAMAATANATVQMAAPDELRGRVISVYTTVFVGSVPAGSLLMGWLASTFGVAVSLAIGGVGCLLSGLLVLAWLRRIRGADLFRAAPAAGREQVTSAAAARPR
jgi:MFS family permease